jgi:hypothetical protein
MMRLRHICGSGFSSVSSNKLDSANCGSGSPQQWYKRSLGKGRSATSFGSPGVADPEGFWPGPDLTFENVRIPILTYINFRQSFFWIFFWWKYALKSKYMNQKVKQQRFSVLCLWHTPKKLIFDHLSRPGSESGSNWIQIRNTGFTSISQEDIFSIFVWFLNKRLHTLARPCLCKKKYILCSTTSINIIWC